jgi:hypothetical protein
LGAGFTASLTDSTGGTGTASVTYQTGNLLGVSQSVITVTGDTTAEGTSQTVAIGGVPIGTIAIDATGSGTLTVPTATLTAAVAVGTTVGVGPLTGSFAASTTGTGTGDGDADDGDGNSGGCLHGGASAGFTSSLSDTSGNTATVTSQVGNLLGVSETVFKVTGDTSAAGTSVALAIGGTPIGNVMLDSTGAGTLIVPTSSLTTSAATGTAVTLGTLSGTFAAQTGTGTGVGLGCSNSGGLTSSLTDPTGGTGTATVTLNTGKLLGVPQTVIKVTGDTTAEGTSQTVTVNGVTVGLVAIDSTGSGTLTVPTSSLTTPAAVGSTLTVGGLSGTFSANTSASVHAHHHWR